MVAKWPVGRNNLRKGGSIFKRQGSEILDDPRTKEEKSLDRRDKGKTIKKQNSPC